jgi:uncharacterized membrane protein YGL010W
MLSFLPFSLANSGSLFEINLGLILTLALGFIYVKIEMVSGSISCAFYVTLTLIIRNCYLSAVEKGTTHSFFLHNIFWHVVGWAIQIAGHKIFESNRLFTSERNPAFMDNLLLTLVAPDFVIIEILFFLGWRPETEKRVQKRIDANIEEFKKSSQKK